MIIDLTYSPPEGITPTAGNWTTMVAGELGFAAFPDTFGIVFGGAPNRKHPDEQVAVTVFIEPEAYAAAADYLESVVAELRSRA